MYLPLLTQFITFYELQAIATAGAFESGSSSCSADLRCARLLATRSWIMHLSRRSFFKCSGAAGLALVSNAPAATPATGSRVRRFHACSNTAALDADPDLLGLFEQSGVDMVWLAGYFYGYWPYPVDHLVAWRERILARGLGCEIVNIPLGHPGDSLGAPGDTVPLTPPTSWRMAVRPDGTQYSGTSLHPPATPENVAAVQRLAEANVRQIFLDDDFRLATGPGVIGGCFCDAHKTAFLQRGGYESARWDELLGDVHARNLSPILRDWVEFTCDELTGCFTAQREAAPDIELGNMIMYLGAEKAGIRLADYRDVLFRVGELMFNDASFSPVKGKCDELFSCLFHRRYARPELAYSETTAYPAHQLSAANMAAKLAVSTIADVRNTMYMSGLTPIPNAHWDVLAPAMKKHASIHKQLAGHRPRGPFKHYWGDASRYVGDDKPNSLFLASGVPFEVVDTLRGSGYAFLSEWDARDVAAGKISPDGVIPISRDNTAAGMRAIPEDLNSIFAFKHAIAPELSGVPHVLDDKPAVCAWYPSASKVLLWNLAAQDAQFVVSFQGRQISVAVKKLDVGLVDLDAV